MNTFKIIVAIVVGFLLGAGAVLSRAPAVAVHEEFQPASIRAPGPDWMQPGDEQAVAILALNVRTWDDERLTGDPTKDDIYYRYGQCLGRLAVLGAVTTPAVMETQSGYTMRWCSDGEIWPARSDGSCWMVDKPKR